MKLPFLLSGCLLVATPELPASDEVGELLTQAQSARMLSELEKERDLLERDFGEEWVDEMEAAVQKHIDDALGRKN